MPKENQKNPAPNPLAAKTQSKDLDKKEPVKDVEKKSLPAGDLEAPEFKQTHTLVSVDSAGQSTCHPVCRMEGAYWAKISGSEDIRQVGFGPKKEGIFKAHKDPVLGGFQRIYHIIPGVLTVEVQEAE